MQYNINNLLLTLFHSHRSLNEKQMEKIGLHSGQAQVLFILWKRDGVSQSDIAKELEISAPSVNSLVSKLEKSKLIICRNCPKDKRLKRVYLTEKGCEIRDEAEKQWSQLEDLILKDFSDTEKVLVLMLLEKIKNNLQTEFIENSEK